MVSGGVIAMIISLFLVLFDFIFFCDFGKNQGEGCGLLMLFAMLPATLFTGQSFASCSSVLNDISPSIDSWHICGIPIMAVGYFITGGVIGLIIAVFIDIHRRARAFFNSKTKEKF